MTAKAGSHDVFQAVADPTRRRLMKMIAGRELSVAAMTEQVTVTRTAVNKHLTILKEAGLVTNHKKGRESRYSLNPEPLRELKSWLAFFDQYWDDKLDQLKNLLEEE